jgi:hypothetical protein
VTVIARALQTEGVAMLVMGCAMASGAMACGSMTCATVAAAGGCVAGRSERHGNEHSGNGGGQDWSRGGHGMFIGIGGSRVERARPGEIRPGGPSGRSAQ